MRLFPIRNVGLKLLSIAVAVLLWLVVAGDPIGERTVRVGLELQRTPDELELVGPVPDAVSVRLRGPASQLSGLGAPDVSVVVDLDGARPGRRLFTLTAAQVSTPYGVEVMQISPPTLALVFEPRASRMIAVRPQIEGSPAIGHNVTNVSVSPSEVRIEGPQSAVARLDVVATEPVSVERATTLVREAVALDLPESGVRLASGSGTAVVTVTVSADATERTVTAVPITVRGGASVKVWPETASVVVEGAAAVVQSLTAEDIMLFVVVAEPGDAGEEYEVHAEAAAHFVVRAIVPARVRLQAASRRR